MVEVRGNMDNDSCFSREALVRSGDIILNVAPACNMLCTACRKMRGGGFLSPDEAIERVADAAMTSGRGSGIALAGPGEPLVNAPTYVVLRRLHRLYPDLPVTVWTNGLLLNDRLEELVRSGVKRVVVSLNAATPGTATQVYDWVIHRARRYAGREAAEKVMRQQWTGIVSAVAAGLTVIGYTTIITGVNEHEIEAIRQRAKNLGAADVLVDPVSDLKKRNVYAEERDQRLIRADTRSAS